MSQAHDGHDPLHQALLEIGPDLPEPSPRAALRASIAGAPPAPRVAVRPDRWRPLRTGVLAAAGLGLVAFSAAMLIENQRLRHQLAQTIVAGGAGAVAPASRELPPLVAVRFFHPQCQVAREVAPRFEAMERAHGDEQVLFVSLDISEPKEAQSAKLVGALDCGFVFQCDGAPISSGMVVLADTRSKKVIKASHSPDELGELEKALDEALLTCARGG